MKYCFALILLVSTLAISTSQAALVAHWPLDTDAADSTGNGHNGSVVGGIVTFGQPGANANTGTAAAFPDEGHIEVPYAAALNPGIQAPDGSGSFTVAMWVNAASSTLGYNSPFTAREDNGATVNGPIIYNDNAGNWSYWAGNNGASGAWNPLNTDPVILDTWQHIAITYDSSTITRKMFIDGVEVVSANLGVSANVLRDIHIGSGADDGLSFYWDGLIDDVGLWDEALDDATIQSIMANGIASGSPDPALVVGNPIDLALDGSVQTFDIPITNGGQTETLTVSGAVFTGDPNFTVTTLPGPILAGGTDNLVITFDPAGGNGAFEADLEITSNDSLNPTKTITLRGAIHDPMVIADAILDLGTETTGSTTISNGGATRILNVSSATLSGDDAGLFTVASFPSTVSPGSMGDIVITFNAAGTEGNFSAILEVASDDPITPTTQIEVRASIPFTDTLVAWWPLDVDGTDASGNGFDGVPTIALTQCPGANGATGTSLEFDGGTTRIDVPFDTALNPESFTVTLWANADTTDGFASPITSRDDVAGPITHGYIIYNDNGGNWNFWTGDGDAGWDTLVGPPVTVATWTHLAITYDADTDTKTLFVDGDIAATDNVPQSGAAQYVVNGTLESEDLHIGAGQDDGLNFWFTGKIDDVALFRVPLPESDIETIMADGVAGFAGSGALFQMLSLEFAPQPDEITVTFSSVDGADYAIERSSDLTGLNSTPGSWEELTDNHKGTGEITSFTDSDVPAGATRLFYRARRL